MEKLSSHVYVQLSGVAFDIYLKVTKVTRVASSLLADFYRSFRVSLFSEYR